MKRYVCASVSFVCTVVTCRGYIDMRSSTEIIQQSYNIGIQAQECITLERVPFRRIHTLVGPNHIQYNTCSPVNTPQVVFQWHWKTVVDWFLWVKSFTSQLHVIMPRGGATAYGSSFVCLFVCLFVWHSVCDISFAAHVESWGLKLATQVELDIILLFNI